jgi:arylsulfatase A-like enzyme
MTILRRNATWTRRAKRSWNPFTTGESIVGPATFAFPLILAAWFGLVAGLIELGLLEARNYFSGWSSLSSLQISRHYPWMIPCANFVVFVTAGLCLGLLARVWPHRSARISHVSLTFLTFLALLLTIPGLYKVACLTMAAGLSSITFRWVPAHSSRLRRFVVATLPFLFVFAAVHVGWRVTAALVEERWAKAWLPPARPGTPNVLLVVMDTVRADRMSQHGYHRDTTPNLARLARKGILFEQARSTAPWTLPSHASMFTGRWPHETSVGEDRPLDASHPTLAQFLSGQGYSTAGFVANTYYCNSWFGLGKGFARYEDFYDEDSAVSFAETLRCSTLGRSLVQLARMPLGNHRRRKDAAQIKDDFLDWLSEQDAGRPFFAFLNLFDAHTPYVLPEGYDRHFGLRPEGPADVALLNEWDKKPRRNVPEREQRLVSDAYDDCIGYIDTELGKLFDGLERRGVLENTLVVLTSDHGENFGEHGLYGHGKSLYRQETHVPLVIVLPGGHVSGRKVADPVSLRDIPATVVDVIRQAGSSPFPGESLARYWQAEAAPSDREGGVAFSEVTLRETLSKNPNRPPAWRGPMQSLAAAGKSYIRNADGHEELFDLTADPTESRDLAGAADSGAILEELRSRLSDFIPSMAASK